MAPHHYAHNIPTLMAKFHILMQKSCRNRLMGSRANWDLLIKVLEVWFIIFISVGAFYWRILLRVSNNTFYFFTIPYWRLILSRTVFFFCKNVSCDFICVWNFKIILTKYIWKGRKKLLMENSDWQIPVKVYTKTNRLSARDSSFH